MSGAGAGRPRATPVQVSLFDELPAEVPPADTRPVAPAGVSPSLSTALALGRGTASERGASKARVAFERLVASVEAARTDLAGWESALERFRSRVAGEVEPARAALHAEQRELVVLLDRLLVEAEHADLAGTTGRNPAARLGRAPRGTLRRLLIDLVASMLDRGHDPALVAIHDRHAAVGHAEARAAELAATRAMLKVDFGIDLGGDVDGDRNAGLTSDDLIERAGEQLRAAARAEEEARAARRAERARARAGANRATGRDEPAAAQGGDDRADGRSRAGPSGAARDDRAADAARAMREVYRSLASALHPDREPDAGERERKTRLMQRANDAHAAGDLLGLLELQLEAEREDPGRLGGLPEARLTPYTRLLRAQLKELEREIEACRAPFGEDEAPVHRAAWNRSGPAAVHASLLRRTPTETVDRAIDAELAELRGARGQIAHDRAAFADPARRLSALRDAAAGRTPGSSGTARTGDGFLPDDPDLPAAPPARGGRGRGRRG